MVDIFLNDALGPPVLVRGQFNLTGAQCRSRHGRAFFQGKDKPKRSGSSLEMAE
jgi:hypothetical protein